MQYETLEPPRAVLPEPAPRLPRDQRVTLQIHSQQRAASLYNTGGRNKYHIAVSYILTHWQNTQVGPNIATVATTRWGRKPRASLGEVTI